MKDIALESLYFIGIVPPEKIRDEITQLKVLMAERFNSKHALKSPPHITLHMPFKWKEKKRDALFSALHRMEQGLEPFQLMLEGFGFFEPRVVYVDTLKNKALDELQRHITDVCRKQLHLNNANYKDRPFNPHMTIGFRDLRKPMFAEAKKYFEKREYHAQFLVTELQLFRYSSQKWQFVDREEWA